MPNFTIEPISLNSGNHLSPSSPTRRNNIDYINNEVIIGDGRLGNQDFSKNKDRIFEPLEISGSNRDEIRLQSKSL